MKYETFIKAKRVMALIFAIIMANAIIMDNWILAIAAAATTVALSLFAKKKVKGVINDERDYANAGKAARMALSVFSITGATLSFVFTFMHYQAIGSILAYSVCSLLLIYTAFFSYYAKQN